MSQTVREVIAYTRHSRGLSLHLADCGHRVWQGGDGRTMKAPLRVSCNQWPCYQPERAMGNDH